VASNSGLEAGGLGEQGEEVSAGLGTSGTRRHGGLQRWSRSSGILTP